MKKTFFLTLLTALLTIGTTTACTNFIVTKGASKDGSCFLTYSADSHTLYGELYYRPAMDWPAGTMMDVIEWDTGEFLGQIPQAAHTYSVVGNMNEYQLAIGETTYGGIEALMHGTGLMDYGSLMYIALQRAKTAREAIVVISGLLDQYGYHSEGESLSIVDPDEAWVMDLIGKGDEMRDAKGRLLKGWSNGAVWVARRVPDGYVSGHANQSRITTFPLSDGKTSITNRELDKINLPGIATVYSHDVISFAKLKGLYPEKADDAGFSFCDTYNPINFDGARYCESRVWAFFNHCNHEAVAQYEDYARGDNLKNRFPLWIKPADKSKIDAKFMMEMMRDHFEGTSMDMTRDLGAGPFACPYRWRPMEWECDGKTYIHERATATQQTGFTFVAQCRSWLPDIFGGIFWFAVDDCGTNCFMPMFCGITEIPEPVRAGNGSIVEYSPTSAYWTFSKVSNFAYSRYKDMIVPIKEKQNYWEKAFMKEIQDMEGEMKPLCANDAKAARQKLNACSDRAVHAAVDEWNDLFTYLLVKYNDGNVKKEENGRFVKTDARIPQAAYPDQPAYPVEWYRMIVKDCGDNILKK